MTISTINKDLAFETFQYLPEKDIIECGKVNKQWKQAIKENETKLFSEDFLAIKEARDTFIRTRHLLEAVNREIAALEDFFAKRDDEGGLFKRGLSSFFFISGKCALRREKNELLEKLKADTDRLSCINRVELLTLKNFKNHFDIMYLFRGREEYNKLPIIDITHIQPKGRESIHLIKPADMENVDSKASIMRGFDGSECEFFTLKFRLVKDGTDTGNLYCATIFERKEGNGVWAHTASEKKLPFDKDLIFEKEILFYNNGNEFYEPPDSKLAKLISTGMLINSETREVFLLA